MHQEHVRSQKRYRILIFSHLPLNLLKLPAALSAVWIFFSIFASRKTMEFGLENETEKNQKPADPRSHHLFSAAVA